MFWSYCPSSRTKYMIFKTQNKMYIYIVLKLWDVQYFILSFEYHVFDLSNSISMCQSIINSPVLTFTTHELRSFVWPPSGRTNSSIKRKHFTEVASSSKCYRSDLLFKMLQKWPPLQNAAELTSSSKCYRSDLLFKMPQKWPPLQNSTEVTSSKCHRSNLLFKMLQKWPPFQNATELTSSSKCHRSDLLFKMPQKWTPLQNSTEVTSSSKCYRSGLLFKML